MAKAQNKVIAGDYNGRDVTGGFGVISLYGGRSVNSIPIDKKTVEAYELVTDEHRKSAASGAARGLVGGVLLGPVGALAGGLSATNKGVYIVAVQFKDGKKSLLEVNDKMYKLIVTNCFAYSPEAPSEEPSASPAASASQAAGSSGSANRSLPKEDYAIGINSVDSPMPGYEPKYAVNMNNRKLAVKAVSAIDSYLSGKSDIDAVIDIIEECALNVSHEKSKGNWWADSLGGWLESVSSADMSTIKIMFSGNGPVKLQMLVGLLIDRNRIARFYLVDEKINVKRVSAKILDMVRRFINGETDKYDTSVSLILYRDTLDIYLDRTEKDDSPFNDDDVKQIYELSKKFSEEMPDSDEDMDKEKLQAIADEIAGIVDSLPDAPSVDVYFEAKESPAQEPESQKESEPAAEVSQDTAEAASASSADEIRKYKELLDDGIITQEEFDAKKKQLMGL